MGFNISSAIGGGSIGAIAGGALAAVTAGASIPLSAAASAGVGAIAGGFLGGGGSGGVSGVSTDIKLSKEGEALKNQLFETIRTQKFPAKLSSQLIGNALKAEQGKRRVREKALTTTSRSPDVVQSNIGQVIGTGIGSIPEAGAGPRAVFEGKREFERDRFADLQNIINIERQVPAFVQQAQFTNQLLEQQRRAERGAALGLGAQVAGAALSKIDFSNIFTPSPFNEPGAPPIGATDLNFSSFA